MATRHIQMGLAAALAIATAGCWDRTEDVFVDEIESLIVTVEGSEVPTWGYEEELYLHGTESLRVTAYTDCYGSTCTRLVDSRCEVSLNSNGEVSIEARFLVNRDDPFFFGGCSSDCRRYTADCGVIPLTVGRNVWRIHPNGTRVIQTPGVLHQSGY